MVFAKPDIGFSATIESAAPAIAETPAHQPEQATGEAAGRGDISIGAAAGRALDALSGAAHGLSRIAESVAEGVASAVDAIAGLFGGGSAPAPQQEQERPAPTPASAFAKASTFAKASVDTSADTSKQEQPKERPVSRPQSMEEFLAREQQQLSSDRAQFAQRIGQSADSPMTKEQLEAAEMEQQRRNRDGGISR